MGLSTVLRIPCILDASVPTISLFLQSLTIARHMLGRRVALARSAAQMPWIFSVTEAQWRSGKTLGTIVAVSSEELHPILMSGCTHSRNSELKPLTSLAFGKGRAAAGSGATDVIASCGSPNVPLRGLS